jgi:hypothetical protein
VLLWILFIIVLAGEEDGVKDGQTTFKQPPPNMVFFQKESVTISYNNYLMERSILTDAIDLTRKIKGRYPASSLVF